MLIVQPGSFWHGRSARFRRGAIPSDCTHLDFFINRRHTLQVNESFVQVYVLIFLVLRHVDATTLAPLSGFGVNGLFVSASSSQSCPWLKLLRVLTTSKEKTISVLDRTCARWRNIMLLYGNMASRLDKCYAAFGINIYHRRIPQDYAIEHRQDHGLLVMPVSLIFTFSTCLIHGRIVSWDMNTTLLLTKAGTRKTWIVEQKHWSLDGGNFAPATFVVCVLDNSTAVATILSLPLSTAQKIWWQPQIVLL